MLSRRRYANRSLMHSNFCLYVSFFSRSVISEPSLFSSALTKGTKKPLPSVAALRPFRSQSALRHCLYYGIYRASHLAAWMPNTRSGPGTFISTGAFTGAQAMPCLLRKHAHQFAYITAAQFTHDLGCPAGI
jgi:hypothetical protein